MSCDRAKEVQLKKWLTSARRQRSTHETQAEAFNSTCPQVLFISLNKSKWQESINMWRIHFWCAFAAGVVFIGLQFKNQQKYAIRRRVPNPFAYNCMTYADRCKWGGGKKERGGRKNKSALWLGLHLEKGCWELVGNWHHTVTGWTQHCIIQLRLLSS